MRHRTRNSLEKLLCVIVAVSMSASPVLATPQAPAPAPAAESLLAPPLSSYLRPPLTATAFTQKPPASLYYYPDSGAVNRAKRLPDPSRQHEIIFAQAPAPPQSAPRGPVAGGEAAARLAAAEALAESGDLAGAATDALGIIRDYHGTHEAMKADGIIGRLAKGYATGELPARDFEAWEASLPLWESLSSVEKFQVAGAQSKAVEHALLFSNPETAAQAAPRALASIKRFVAEHPESFYHVSLVGYWPSVAEVLGPETLWSALQDMKRIANRTDAPLLSFAANSVLRDFVRRVEHNDIAPKQHAANVIEAAEAGALDELLSDPYVPAWVKGWNGYYVVMAFAELGQHQRALEHLDALLAMPLGGRTTHHLLRYQRAKTLQALSPQDLDAPVQALWDLLKEYPQASIAPRCLLELSAMYTTEGDYDGAAAILAELLSRFPESQEAVPAADALNYLNAYLRNTMPIATTPSPGGSTVLAKANMPWCGPAVLERLLRQQGITATQEELALAASTDDSGTSMLGLIEAAAAKGLTLTGLEVEDLRMLPAPYIALLEEQHFVLFEGLSGEFARLYDPAQGETLLPVEAYAARAEKQVLLPMSEAQLQAHGLLGRERLAALRGANNPPSQPPPPPPPCVPSATVCCPQNSGSSSGGSHGSSPPMAAAAPPMTGLPGAVGSPTANSGASSAGVNPQINTFITSLDLNETDLSITGRGGMNLFFVRAYHNAGGFHRGEFIGADTPWRTVGEGWTHNYNAFLKTSTGTPPSSVTFVDERGFPRVYNRDGMTDNYYVGGGASTGERGNVLTLNGDDTYSLTFNAHTTYHFSEPTNDADRYARLESIEDAAGNVITLSYDGAVGTGKLTKVSSPQGDAQHLALSYTGNLITKVELKENANVLQEVAYAYTSNELTTVTDNDSHDVDYTYASTGGVTGSRYISAITDKRSNTTSFDWSYGVNSSFQYEAYKIEVTNAAGLVTVYDRNLTSSVCAITNWDSTTQLTKFVHTPVSGDTSRTQYKDYYLDSTNFERWTYDYTNGDLYRLHTPGSVVSATYTWNSDGRIATFTQGASGPSTSYAYTGGGSPTTTVTGPDGLDTVLTYDSTDRLVSLEHPSLAAPYLYGYDAHGQLEEIENPLGEITEFTYDSAGNMNSTTVDPTGLNLTTSLVYDDLGNVIEQTDARGKTTYFDYGGAGCGCGGGAGELVRIEDPLGNETFFEYDENGNRKKIIDALGRETDFEYDGMNRLVKIISPSGSANEMSFSYNKLGQLTWQTSFENITTTYDYDHMGRQVEVSDPEATITTAYNSAGQLASVTDGNNHTTTYTYDSLFRLELVTDPIGKKTHYAYDAAGRRESVGAGTLGDFDPTEYFYANTTGLLEKVRYHAGVSYHDAEYFYDDMARLEKIEDWLGGNGLRYAYDAAGRMTKLTDYDDSTLDYEYDAAGNVVEMNDYHGNETAYVYDNAGRLTSMTAPGSKTWTFAYNSLNQPTVETLPNGMATFYTYDAKNRLEKIDHKDAVVSGSTVLSFEYTLDDDGNITRIDENDGHFWEYAYDGRNRLTGAVHSNANQTIAANYAYTYDDGDNMTQKVEPFFDDFNDGNLTGWGLLGTWSASSGAARNTVAGSDRAIYKDSTDADNEISFRYVNNDTSNNARGVLVDPRYVNNHNVLQVRFFPDQVNLLQISGGVATFPAANTSVTSTQGTPYDVRIVSDGSSLKVYRAEVGGQEELVLSATVSVLTNARIYIGARPNSDVSLDNIRILADNLASTWTMTSNNANELTQMQNSAQGSTITYTYDAMGRTTEKALGAKSAEYAWRYDSKLHTVTSNHFDEGNVSYDYGADGKRRSRTHNSVTTGYNWAGWNVINEETGAGDLAMSYVHNPQRLGRATLAQIAGNNPASGTAHYFTHDHLGSTRSAYTAAKALTASFAYTAYGEAYSGESSLTTHRYTGHKWDHASRMYFAPHRYLAPANSKWLMRDPLGMVDGPNSYLYVGARPILFTDPSGLHICIDLDTGKPACRRNPRCPKKHPCAGPFNGPGGVAACQECCDHLLKDVRVDPVRAKEACYTSCVNDHMPRGPKVPAFCGVSTESETGMLGDIVTILLVLLLLVCPPAFSSLRQRARHRRWLIVFLIIILPFRGQTGELEILECHLTINDDILYVQRTPTGCVAGQRKLTTPTDELTLFLGAQGVEILPGSLPEAQIFRVSRKRFFRWNTEYFAKFNRQGKIKLPNLGYVIGVLNSEKILVAAYAPHEEYKLIPLTSALTGEVSLNQFRGIQPRMPGAVSVSQPFDLGDRKAFYIAESHGIEGVLRLMGFREDFRIAETKFPSHGRITSLFACDCCDGAIAIAYDTYEQEYFKLHFIYSRNEPLSLHSGVAFPDAGNIRDAKWQNGVFFWSTNNPPQVVMHREAEKRRAVPLHVDSKSRWDFSINKDFLIVRDKPNAIRIYKLIDEQSFVEEITSVDLRFQ